jgi:hypothetical protein
MWHSRASDSAGTGVSSSEAISSSSTKIHIAGQREVRRTFLAPAAKLACFRGLKNYYISVLP